MKKKKTPRQKLKKRLEDKVKLLVKLRDNYTCQKSGERVSGANCHASHIIPVSADGRLAFEPLNLKVLSYHWHMNWWHKNPIEAGDWIKKKFPDRVKFLEAQKIKNRKKGNISMIELEEREQELGTALKEYEEPKPRISVDDLKYL